MKNTLLLLIIISGLVLGYGYWHSITHASAHIDLVFKAGERGKSERLSKAQVLFMNVVGQVLAKGVSDEKYDFIHLIHPQAGDCHERVKQVPQKEARIVWQQCFKQQSKWLPTWVKDVRQVEVRHKQCASVTVPIEIAEHNTEWLLWWVPLPHVGGIPYSYYRASIIIDHKDCLG